MTARITGDDPNMSFLINSKAEARLWGSVTERGAKRNRRLRWAGVVRTTGNLDPNGNPVHIALFK